MLFAELIMPDYNYTLKLILIGDANVGKSCLLQTFIENTFNVNTNSTIGIEYETKNVVVKGNDVKLSIWDTAGAENYRALTRSYFRG